LFTILPFEKEWFNNRGVKNIVAIKHPLLVHYEDYLEKLPPKLYPKEKINLLILPGSRDSEVERLLPIFLEAAKEISKLYDVKLALVKTTSVSDKYYNSVSDDFSQVYESEDLKYALGEAHLCIAASGTVTLNCALFQVPTIVCYQLSLFNEFMVQNIMKYKWFISLANIVHNELIFPEYVQGNVKANVIVNKVISWLEDESVYNNIVKKLSKTKSLLTGDPVDLVGFMGNVITDNE
ncbi:hypothetical protein N9B72_01045, partial [Bacteriovoracaceae bacterium]|nr:hypothetical protein [Bacteriovoracaceae bacterium]